MNYELAKELKDAGFPQELPNDGGADYYNLTDEGRIVRYRHEMSAPIDPDAVKKPTLSELIEACGEGFANLHRNNENGRWDSWEARGADMNEIYGPTPEEAVARLWLVLNKS